MYGLLLFYVIIDNYIVDLSIQSEIFIELWGKSCTVVPKLWLSAEIQEDEESFNVLNQAFNTCSLHFKF